MIPIASAVHLVENESALSGCGLVLFGEPVAFGLSCWLKVGNENVPGVVGFREQQTEWGPQSFVLTAASLLRADESSPVCIALGKDFAVRFDPESVTLRAHVNPGDLVVLETGLHLLARVVAQPARNYLVNINSGEATKQVNQNGAVIRRWSISIEAHGQIAPVFTRQ